MAPMVCFNSSLKKSSRTKALKGGTLALFGSIASLHALADDAQEKQRRFGCHISLVNYQWHVEVYLLYVAI